MRCMALIFLAILSASAQASEPAVLDLMRLDVICYSPGAEWISGWAAYDADSCAVRADSCSTDDFNAWVDFVVPMNTTYRAIRVYYTDGDGNFDGYNLYLDNQLISEVADISAVSREAISTVSVLDIGPGSHLMEFRSTSGSKPDCYASLAIEKIELWSDMPSGPDDDDGGNPSVPEFSGQTAGIAMLLTFAGYLMLRK
jgi:hypothetical protein